MRNRQSVEEYFAECMAEDPYLAAMVAAIEGKTPEEIDAILEAFPEVDQWQTQQTQQQAQQGDSSPNSD